MQKIKEEKGKARKKLKCWNVCTTGDSFSGGQQIDIIPFT